MNSDLARMIRNRYDPEESAVRGEPIFVWIIRGGAVMYLTVEEFAREFGVTPKQIFEAIKESPDSTPWRPVTPAPMPARKKEPWWRAWFAE